MRPVLRVLLLCLATNATARAAESVELDYRLRADRDLISEQVNENVTTMRVLTDRGVVARSAARGVSYPLTYHVISRQRYRFTTGPAGTDGSFPATLAVLDRSTSLRLASGEEQPVPGPALGTMVFKATIDPQGHLLQPSVVSDSTDPDGQEAFKTVLASVLEQAARIEPLRVEEGKAAQQVVNLKLPLPGLAPLDLRITATNRLMGVTDGVARVELVYAMAFGVPEGPVKIEASGTGGGTMLYDIGARLARRLETNTLMNIVADAPDGRLEFQMNTRQTQTMRPAAP
ncbi:hypothetical protein [Hydrogenophaga sp.]|uniref:hypothetical protein n=1 Tax=Hydrogenophaga sp. TaxID=1904254 RepID=UPI0035AFBD6C